MNQGQLDQCLQKLLPGASYSVIMDTIGNASIGMWNNAVGAQPTQDQLNATLAQIELDQAKAAKDAVLRAAYVNVRYGKPVTITTASNASLTFPTDQLTQTNVMGYLGVLAKMADPPAQLPLQDASGTVQVLTPADVQKVGEAIMLLSISAWQTVVTLEMQLFSAATLDQVNAINWPS